MHSRLVLGCLLATVGCGPPQLGDDSTSEHTTSSTAVEESGTTDSSMTTLTTEGPLFIPSEDMGAECDPWVQDCPEGEKCVPYSPTGGSWDDHKCVPVMGDGAPGAPCWYGGVVEATDNCDATSFCWDVMDVDGEPIGICHALCTGSADDPVCPPMSACLIAGNSVLNLCVGACNPLLQQCGPGRACYWANGNFNCVFTSADIPAGQACGFVNDCAAGLVCLEASVLPACEGDSCCSGFCDLDLGDAPCEALLPGTNCVALFPEGQAPPGYEQVGICTLPP